MGFSRNWSPATDETDHRRIVVNEHRVHDHSDIPIEVCERNLDKWMTSNLEEPFPACVSPVIAAFLGSWRLDLDSGSEEKLIRPLLSSLVGTREELAIEKKRIGLVVEWLANVNLSRWALLDIQMNENRNTSHKNFSKWEAATARISNALKQIIPHDDDAKVVLVLSELVNENSNRLSLNEEEEVQNALGASGTAAAFNVGHVEKPYYTAVLSSYALARAVASSSVLVDDLVATVESLQRSALCLVDQMMET